jgi:hypothetical protein
MNFDFLFSREWHLQRRIGPRGWKIHYADIAQLGKTLTRLDDNDEATSLLNDTTSDDNNCGDHEQFLRVLNSEAIKVNKFYLEQLEIICRELDNIRGSGQEMPLKVHDYKENEPAQDESESQLIHRSKESKHKVIAGLTSGIPQERGPFLRLHQHMRFLHSFGVLNFAALNHAIRKQGSASQELFERASLAELPFVTQYRLTSDMEQIESMFADLFCDGSISFARCVLSRQVVIEEQSTDCYLYYFGLRTGAALILAFWVLWDAVVDISLRPGPGDNDWTQHIFPLYRAVACTLLLEWCWGLLLCICKSFGIDVARLLGFGENAVWDYNAVWSLATNHTIVTLANFLLFFKVLRGDFPAWLPYQIYPSLLFIGYLASLFWFVVPCRSNAHPPVHRAVLSESSLSNCIQCNGLLCRPFRLAIFHLSCGHWARTLGQTVMAPFAPATFAAAFVGNTNHPDNRTS